MSEQSGPARVPEESSKRRYVRVEVGIDVTYHVPDSDVPHSGFSCDLGGGGIRLSTDEDLALGTALLLRFRLPGSERESVVRGRIVLSFYNAADRRFMHGIAFTRIDPRDQDRIVDFVVAETQRQAHEGDAPRE